MTVLDYLKEIIQIPSPTGYTNRIQNYLIEKLKFMGYNPIHTPKGNIYIEVLGKNNDKARYITAHVDTLGAMVKSVKDNNRLMIHKIGGFPFNMIEGENCIVHTDKGDVTGTILLHQTSCHVYTQIEDIKRTRENMEIRLDTREKIAQVGDFVSFDPRFQIQNDYIKSRFLDDKVSVAILLNLLEKKPNLEHKTYFAFSVVEEVGIGANSSIPKDVVEYLAIDMGAIGDYQETDEYSVSICAKDSSGPYNYNLRKNLEHLAKENNIDYRVDLYPNYGSDASAAMRAGADVAHALIGVGVESSHSYERTHLDSIINTEKLIEVYLQSSMKG